MKMRKQLQVNALFASLAVLALLWLPAAVLAQGNGAAVGNPAYATGEFGQAVSLNGSSQFVALGQVFNPVANTTWTAECWANTTTTTGVHVASSGSNVGPGSMLSGNVVADSFYLGDNAGKAQFGAGSSTVTTTTNIADGAWHHLAVVVTTNTSAAIYVDGVLAGSGAISWSPQSTEYFYAGAWASTASYWVGSIDEVSFSTTAQYSAAFTRPSAAFTTSRSGQVGLFHLDGAAWNEYANNVYADNAAWVTSPYNHNLVGTVSGSVDTSVNAGYYRRIYETGATSSYLSFGTIVGTGDIISYRYDGGNWTRANVAATVSLTTPTNTTVSHLLEFALAATPITSDLWSNSPPTNALQFYGLTLSTGAVVSAPALRPKNTLVYGDSISIGARTLAANGGYPATDNDATLSAYFQLQDTLNSEIGLVGFAGQGIVSTANSASENIPVLSSTYNLIYSGVSRTFVPQPDLCIICEGQNDGGSSTSSFLAGLNTVIAGDNAKKTLVMGDENGYFTTQEQAATGATYATPAPLTLNPSAATTDSYDGIHPTAAAHRAKMLRNITAAAQPILAAPKTVRRIN